MSFKERSIESMQFSGQHCLFESDRAEVWCGDALDQAFVAAVLDGRRVDALIFDAPYSERTHSGHREGKLTADRAAAYAARGAGDRKRERAYNARKSAAGESGRNDIDYLAWGPDDVRKFGDAWSGHCSGWWVSITDDVLAPIWRLEMEHQGLYPFCPLPFVETGSRVRMTGDGPSNWTCWTQVARPRNATFASWGTLRGAYIIPGERAQNSTHSRDRITGGKPMRGMIELVEDYSRPGDLVCDPVAGAATTGLAALRTGRRCLLIEKDPERAQLSADRIKAEISLTDRRVQAAGQVGLFEAAQ